MWKITKQAVTFNCADNKWRKSKRLKHGQRVHIDAIKSGFSRSGFLVRVVGVWKEPSWFCPTWFDELKWLKKS